MIEATCTACGKVLGKFADMGKYTEWRAKNIQCECGAPLDTNLFTSYKAEEQEETNKPKGRRPWR